MSHVTSSISIIVIEKGLHILQYYCNIDIAYRWWSFQFQSLWMLFRKIIRCSAVCLLVLQDTVIIIVSNCMVSFIEILQYLLLFYYTIIPYHNQCCCMTMWDTIWKRQAQTHYSIILYSMCSRVHILCSSHCQLVSRDGTVQDRNNSIKFIVLALNFKHTVE